jgi:type II secretory pathway component GspD/PulD (secretin)
MRTKNITDRKLKMKIIIQLTLAVAFAAGTFQAFAQDDPLARLKAQRAAELQQLNGGQPAPAETPAATPAPDAAAAPADNAPAPQDDALARLKAQRAAELGGLPAGNQPPTAQIPAATAPAMDDQSPMQTPADNSAQTAGYIPATSASLSTNGITFNFRNAPLDQVLTYMSDAAGFIIVENTPVSGNVTVINTHPITKDEAVDLLNSRLNQLGYAAIQDGRTLTIMTKNDAKTGNIPVKVNSDPNLIPKNDVIVTQILPIRFVDAQQLVVDISPFVSPQAIIIANQAGNSIIITDTQSNIRHLAEIIKSIDSSAEMETSVQVFPLKYANPNDVVAALQGVFPSGGTGGTTSVGGGRGGRGGGNPFAALFGGGGGNNGNTSQARVQKAQQVLAVADGRTQSVIVTAAKDMMPQIQDMIDQLDVDSTRTPDVHVVSLKNADPYQMQQALNSIFGGNNSRNTTTTSDTLSTRAASTPTTTSSGSTSRTGTTGRTGGY